MNKEELLIELGKFKKLYTDEKSNCKFLLDQQHWFKSKTEEAMRKHNLVNHELLRLKEAHKLLQKKVKTENFISD